MRTRETITSVSTPRAGHLGKGRTKVGSTNSSITTPSDFSSCTVHTGAGAIFLTGRIRTQSPRLQILQLRFLCLEKRQEPAHLQQKVRAWHDKHHFPDENRLHAHGGFLPGECNSCWQWLLVVCCEVRIKALQRQQLCACFPGACVTEGWQGSFCNRPKGSVGVKASQFWYYMMFCIGNGVSSDRRSCGISRLLMQRAALATQT